MSLTNSYNHGLYQTSVDIIVSERLESHVISRCMEASLFTRIHFGLGVWREIHYHSSKDRREMEGIVHHDDAYCLVVSVSSSVYYHTFIRHTGSWG